MNRKQALDAARMILVGPRAHEAERLDRIADALAPWTPQTAARKIQTKDVPRDPLAGLAARSQTNFLPLIVDVFSQSMKVDNYLASGASESARPWEWWQRNKFDARQTGVHRCAVQYGAAYAVVLPSSLADGRAGANVRGVSPRRLTALYGEESGDAGDDWPILALEVNGPTIRLYDEERVHFIGARQAPAHSGLGWREPGYSAAGNLEYIEARPHDVGVCPVVRYRDRILLDGEEQLGIVEPLISIQSRVDETTYEMMVTQYFSAFRIRYVAGWLPETEQEALRQSSSEIWYFEKPDVKVGTLDASSVSGYIESKQSAVRDLAAIAQVPMQALGVDSVSNVSDAALATFADGGERKISEIQTSLGESHEQMLRTCAHVVGDMEAAGDFAAECKWRDMSARQFSQTVDGLGKLAAMLGVPQEVLWEDIPEWTREKVERAKAARGPSIGQSAS